MIIGFSVKAPKSVQSHAAKSNVPIHLESVIYRLIETVRAKVAALLPPVIETRVLGEATVLQMFSIAVKGKESASIAGCRVSNGVIGRHDLVRVLRGDEREVVFEGESRHCRRIPYLTCSRRHARLAQTRQKGHYRGEKGERVRALGARIQGYQGRRCHCRIPNNRKAARIVTHLYNDRIIPPTHLQRISRGVSRLAT
jgi:hypothetical protein